MPLLVRAALAVCVAGFAFPIYGVTLPIGLKLTLWRMGLPVLLACAAAAGLRLRRWPAAEVLGLFAILGAWRLVTLVMADDRGPGIQQLSWFVEGLVFTAAVAVLSSRYAELQAYLLRTCFYIGLCSIAVMALQFFLLRFGVLLTLPLSTSAVGFPPDLRPWTYPLYGGGRIIGAFMDPNMSGTMCALYVATFLPFAYQGRTAKLLPRWLVVVAVLTALAALIGTGSRQSAVALGLGLAVMSLSLFARRQRAIVRATVVAVTLLAATAAVAGWTMARQVTTPFGELQQSVLVRAATSAGGDITGGRLSGMRDLVASLKPGSLIWGIGEGEGDFTAHNAYLIVLSQNGLIGLGLLVTLSASLLLRLAHQVMRADRLASLPASVGSLAVATAWLALVLANWAQLNQSVSYLYLAIAVLPLNGAAIGHKAARHVARGTAGRRRPPVCLDLAAACDHVRHSGLAGRADGL